MGRSPGPNTAGTGALTPESPSASAPRLEMQPSKAGPSPTVSDSAGLERGPEPALLILF